MSSSSPAILHVITSLGLGGAENMLLRLCRQLREKNVPCAVISLKSRSDLSAAFAEAGIPVYYVRLAWPFSWLQILSLPRELPFKPTVIQGWLPHGNIAAFLIQKWVFPKAKLAWNIRQSLHTWGTSSSLTKFLIRQGAKLSRWPHKIIYNSQTGLKHHTDIGYRDARAEVIPNGFEADQLEAAQRARIVYRQQLRLREKDVAVIHVARFDPAKDHETFLKAAALAMETVPGLQVIAVGKHVNYENTALTAHIPFHLKERFLLMDEHKDVAQILAAADIYCSSSEAEAFSNAIGEAMGVGLPCVVTDVGDSRLIVGPNNLVVPPKDVPALAEALKHMAKLSAHERHHVGTESQKRLRSLYSLESITDQYIQLYKNI